jgi:hypothetical protein
MRPWRMHGERNDHRWGLGEAAFTCSLYRNGKSKACAVPEVPSIQLTTYRGSSAE